MSEEFHQSPNYESIMLKPVKHLYNYAKEPQMAGFIKVINQLIKAPQEAVEVTLEVMYLVERSACLTDDVLDNSKFRGNFPTAHQVFGVPHSLAASWYSMYMACERLFALKQPQAVELLVKNLKMSVEGQAMENIWRDSRQCPTEQEYHAMVIKKTGYFMCLYTDLLQLFAQDQRDFKKFIMPLARHIQVLDDLDDLLVTQDGNYSEDINEGKFGLPLVIAINRHPQKLDNEEIAARMADKSSRRSYIQSLLEKSNALICCQEIMSELQAEIRMELNALGGSEIADFLLSIRFDP